MLCDDEACRAQWMDGRRVAQRNLLQTGHSAVGGECIVLWSALKGFFTRQRDEGAETSQGGMKINKWWQLPVRRTTGYSYPRWFGFGPSPGCSRFECVCPFKMFFFSSDLSAWRSLLILFLYAPWYPDSCWQKSQMCARPCAVCLP